MLAQATRCLAIFWGARSPGATAMGKQSKHGERKIQDSSKRACFGQQRAARRINTKVNEWKSKLLLPGTQVSWLHMTKDGRFLRNACAKYSPEKAVPLTDTGTQATIFTRLGTFRSHAKSGNTSKQLLPWPMTSSLVQWTRLKPVTNTLRGTT